MLNASSASDDMKKLPVRMKSSLASSRHKPSDSELLQAKRQELDVIGQKVEKARHAAKAAKESSMLRQQRQVWNGEWSQLRKAGCDFVKWMKPGSGPTHSAMPDSTTCSVQEDGLFPVGHGESCTMATLEPVYQCGDGLCFTPGGKQQQLSEHPSTLEPVHLVKDQQDGTNADFKAEYLDMDLKLEKHLTPDNLVMTASIPKEVLDSDCPYPDLKDFLIQAFLSLSEKYQSRLQSIQNQLQTTDRFCGWRPEDHKQFLFILSRYTYGIPNYRALLMDMLVRVFPGRTKKELIDHERVWNFHCFMQNQLKVVTQQWQRDQEQLRFRALVLLQEAKHAHQAELELRRDRKQHQDHCLHLKQKMLQWRAQQEEVAKLEAAIAARDREKEEAELKKQQEKLATIRSQQKEKVKQFHLKEQNRLEKLLQRDQERLDKLRSIMAEQARQDKQRVQIRAELLEQRRMDRKAQELERQKEEQEREKRLEALRKQVEVVAQADPKRMMADTEAWRNRHLDEKEFSLQRPLYNINTYTDTQILSDPRVRLELALREADVHHSPYAKEVLSVVRPHKPPRRDTKSMFKF